MNEKLPKTRKEALEIGASHYFTGVACKYGHVSKRRVNGHCVQCQRERNKEQGRPAYHDTQAWKDYQKKYQAKYRKDPDNQERLRANQLKYYVKKNYNGNMEAYEQARAKREANRAKRKSKKERGE